MSAQSIGPIDTDGTKDSRMNDAITGTEIIIDGGTVRQSEPADRTLDTSLSEKRGLQPKGFHGNVGNRLAKKENDHVRMRG